MERKTSKIFGYNSQSIGNYDHAIFLGQTFSILSELISFVIRLQQDIACKVLLC